MINDDNRSPALVTYLLSLKKEIVSLSLIDNRSIIYQTVINNICSVLTYYGLSFESFRRCA